MSLALLSLLAVALLVGISIGAVGIGGILLIPALTAYGLGVHQAMATALFTFFFTGVAGALLFQRRGSIRWDLTIPVCIGALLCGFLGAWTNAHLDAPVLTVILAALIMFAGLYTLRASQGAQRAPPLEHHPAGQRALLTGIGGFVGFGSGLTGVGGPAVSVPMMVMFGFAPLPTIGVGQVVQIVASISGSAANVRYGTIDFALAVPVTLAQLVGVPIGVGIVHAVSPKPLRRAMAVICIAVGLWLAARVLMG